MTSCGGDVWYLLHSHTCLLVLRCPRVWELAISGPPRAIRHVVDGSTMRAIAVAVAEVFFVVAPKAGCLVLYIMFVHAEERLTGHGDGLAGGLV